MQIPSPNEVRAHHDVLQRGQATVVRFRELKLVVKYGFVLQSECQALWAVRSFTAVPVPVVYGWFCASEKETFLYMSLIEGVTLEERWSSMTSEQRESVTIQLCGIITQLQELRPPPDDVYIGSLDHEPCRDGAIYAEGPFASSKELHDFFVTMCRSPDFGESLARGVRQGLPDDQPIVFTHADLAFCNVMVSADGSRAEALIDWDQAGFYPLYWEWVKLNWKSLDDARLPFGEFINLGTSTPALCAFDCSLRVC
ncbi:kinase-like protein [Artomyces pyxidatus]|uniref:Kinase-like protein n=1 Tax=Artomyces pyxidatus TaxID=48021 RepID=A0ACB8SS69_9AGAM|nr:kinase-like protein [Artomyces pyxidatus]